MMNVALTHVDLVPANERDVLVDGVFTQKRPNDVDVVLVLKRLAIVTVIFSPWITCTIFLSLEGPNVAGANIQEILQDGQTRKSLVEGDDNIWNQLFDLELLKHKHCLEAIHN